MLLWMFWCDVHFNAMRQQIWPACNSHDWFGDLLLLLTLYDSYMKEIETKLTCYITTTIFIKQSSIQNNKSGSKITEILMRSKNAKTLPFINITDFILTFYAFTWNRTAENIVSWLHLPLMPALTNKLISRLSISSAPTLQKLCGTPVGPAPFPFSSSITVAFKIIIIFL